MGITPEGKVKQMVNKLLNTYPPFFVWVTRPVPYGVGESTLDYLGCAFDQDANKPVFFAIETKPPGGKPTERQSLLIQRLRDMRAMVFVIDGPASCMELKQWLDTATGFISDWSAEPKTRRKG